MGYPETVDEGRYNRGSDIIFGETTDPWTRWRRPRLLRRYVLLWIISNTIPERPLGPYQRQRVSTCSPHTPSISFWPINAGRGQPVFPLFQACIVLYAADTITCYYVPRRSHPRTDIVRLPRGLSSILVTCFLLSKKRRFIASHPPRSVLQYYP